MLREKSLMEKQETKRFVMTETLWHALAESYEKAAQFSGFEICRDHWWFYYDETGNYRRISYKNGAVPDMRSITQDFIVGGLVFTSNKATEKAARLGRSLPAPQGEVKSKAILGGSKDLARTLARKEVSRYLDILDDEEVYLHYSSQSNFYYAIVDIVDSLLHFDINRSLVWMHSDLKDALFNALNDDPKRSLDSLVPFGYPNVVGERVGPFCSYLRDAVERTLTETLEISDPWGWFVVETLRQMLKAAENERQLFFLEGNRDSVLVNDFLYNYTQGCHVFPNSCHVFDMETTIARTLGKRANNYVFVDSRDCVHVQLSDVLVGLLSRLFSYLDAQNANTIEAEVERFGGESLHNLKRIRSAIYRASERHVALVHNVNAVSALRWRELALAFLCREVSVYDM